MALASWYKETDGKKNYTKLCRLLVDGGTRAVRCVFDGIHPPSSLKAALNTNKKTLQNLKTPKSKTKKKVLNNEQWDKLYPPSGSSPKSEEFDITLLLVLLRNICGLTAPATGWDVLPLITDNSLEANLARIKYYRNNTIAHKPNTEIDDADFEQHWQDISSALLSLGLSQEDIDDLKSAPLGEKDYNQLLHDWFISDKDIKTQLQEVKTNTADIKSDTADLKSDAADLKSDTADIKSDTADLKSDTADLKSDTADIKSDTADLKSDTADIKSDTAYIKSGTADIKSDTADIKSDAADLKSDTADLKSDTADLKSDTADIKSVTADTKSVTANIKSETALIPGIQEGISQLKNIYSSAQLKDSLINELSYSDFSSLIESLCKSFHPNTRQWVLDEVKSHIDRGTESLPCEMMLISAGPGMGKSTIAAKICQTYKKLGCLAGCHFFQFSNSTRNNSRLMLQSISRHMCDTVPGYRKALECKLQTDFGKKISEMNCEELLTILLEEPLCNVEQTDRNFVIVIDALDECSHDPKDELLKALRKKLSCFPSWLRFILTSRPSTNIFAAGPTITVEIIQEDQHNIKDIEMFFACELEALYPRYDKIADLVQKLWEISKGLFLVAFFVIDVLKRENFASPDQVLELFPNGISSVYENYFSRLKEVLGPYISDEERFFKMLGAVVASKFPIPVQMFYSILGLKPDRDIPRAERKTKKDALSSLHSLFPVENDNVTAFHKTVVDWLALQEDEEHDFSVRVEEGSEVLVNQCYDVLSDIRNGKKDVDKPLNLTNSEKYALKYLCYLIEEQVVRADNYGFFSNIYLLTALKMEDIRFGIRISDGIISRSLLDILDMMIRSFHFGSFHEASCHFYRSTSFGCYLAFVLQAAKVKGVSQEITPNTLVALNKHRFPYLDEKSLWRTPSRGMFFSKHYLFECKKGFIAVFPISMSNSLPTAVYRFELDGRLIRRKNLCEMLITTSANINFIVAAEENGKKIEILDVMTLEVVSQYEFLHGAIETCHVFGNDRDFFVVIKGYDDNKVYVIEGLTGHVRNTFTVTKGSTVMDVSRQGHILVNSMARRSLHLIGKERNISIIKVGEDSILINPLFEKICHCPYPVRGFYVVDEAVNFSPDGRLLAYYFLDSIFIVNTSDGSLFKRLLFPRESMYSCFDVLFISVSYLVIIEHSFMLVVINLQTDEIEHRIYLPYPVYPDGQEYIHNSDKNNIEQRACFPYSVFPNRKKYLLFPEKEGKSFSLISYHFKPSVCEVSRFVFSNLNLQGVL